MERREAPYRYFQTEWLSFTFHSCHLLLHTEPSAQPEKEEPDDGGSQEEEEKKLPLAVIPYASSGIFTAGQGALLNIQSAHPSWLAPNIGLKGFKFYS